MTMLSSILRKRRTSHASANDLAPIEQIRHAAEGLQNLTDAELVSASSDLRDAGSQDRIESGQLSIEAFALATEAVRRSTGKTYYDVQLQAGSVLANGDLAEMATGEGKTLVTLLPVYRAVVAGHNVHVATTNSYLAERDCAELQPAFEMLGVSISLLPEENDDALKREAYGCDVTYGTGYEFGFDYLRDQLLLRNQPEDRLGDSWLRSLTETQKPAARLVQSDRQVTVVDEIDSVLIDEANTPLVISFFASDEIDDAPYRRAAHVADSLTDQVDYHVDTVQKKVTISPSGLDAITARQHKSPKSELQRPWRIYVEQALRARYLLQRDIDYVVKDGAVALVDQQTGRIFAERKWRDGLHQAVEFYEKTPLTPETNSFARISRQRFFTLYNQATGMTGTATDALEEFQSFFSLNVVPIPLNRPSRRIQLPTLFFADSEAKYRAIVSDTSARHKAQQPVLIGTRTIQQSLAIGSLLEASGLPHNILNGLQDIEEAIIVADAGQPGTITVATNMAGRGTDIKLNSLSREVGGLHVIVAEPNRSHRVDRQLLGRCGRQGDPGTCQIFVAADDELLVAVGQPLVRRIRRHANSQGVAAINDDAVLLRLQRQAEHIDYARRKQLMQQAMWVDGILEKLAGTQ